ncbi:MAG: response regulator [Acidobacteria bacterium]|nr:MAG: response regulator [Acidobacteriota bacterium]PIE91108.1 MAG: response regulator [Acidobacteriota bacterium]
MKQINNRDCFCILIVDDEPKNIQLLGTFLEENKYHIEFAMNGEEALDWLEKRSFDLILLDVMMPGLDGYEVCRRVKANPKLNHIPIIFLTAKVETDDIVKGFELGASDYITKPFKPQELLARLRKEVELKTLRGLIPICAKCKDVRNDEGTWTQIETYIESHSKALFSHGICPKCMDELYAEQGWYKKKKDGD